MERYRDFKTRIPKEKKQEDVTPHYEPAPTFIPTTDSFAQLLSSVGNAAVAEFFDRLEIQAKLKTSTPGDFYERQADTIAEQIVQKQDTSPVTEIKIDKVQGKGATGATVPTGIEADIKQLKGKGSALSPPLRLSFETRLGVDLRAVCVHTDDKANALARSVNARAFTYQNEIVFGKGEYNPNSLDGQKLLAHELVHTVQQGGGVQRTPDNNDPPKSVFNNEIGVVQVDVNLHTLPDSSSSTVAVLPYNTTVYTANKVVFHIVSQKQ